MELKKVLTYCFIFLCFAKIYSQDIPEKGVPYLNVYMPEKYGNAGKIWNMESNSQNILFLASDKGLLEFDGFHWKKYRGSKGFTRSLHIANDSLIYTGSDLDFGRWRKNELLEYEYESLYPFKENTGKISEEFWGVYQINDFIIFVSFNNIYVYINGQLTKISAPSRFSGSYKVGKQLYLEDETFGLYRFDGVSLNLEISYPENKPLQVTGIANKGDSLMIVTQNQGVFIYNDGQLTRWSTEISEYLVKDKGFSFSSINENYYVFGTILNGLYITDTSGRIIQNINKQKGLPNNTILDIYYSPNGILWVSMDLGVTGIQLSQNLAYVFDHSGNFGTGQTAIIADDLFYLGTNQGLYTSFWSNSKSKVEPISFELVPYSAGQVWDLIEVDDDILCGHDKGIYAVEEGSFTPINEQIGVLDIVAVDESRILTGTYNGVHLYEKIGNDWTFVQELNYIKGGCNQLVLERDGTLWVLIPNFGVVKTKLNDNFNIDDQLIFPIEDFDGDLLLLEKEKDQIYAVTDKSRFTFSKETNQIKEVKESYQINTVKHRLPGNYRPIELNDTLNFYPIYNGFALKKNQQEEANKWNDTLLIRHLEVFNIDTSFSYSYKKEIPYAYNNLKIDCLVPHREYVNYRYYVEGYMEKWSEWSVLPEIELLNLSEGNYTLIIEGKTDNAIVTTSTILSIETPWYRSVYAYVGYFTVLLLFGFGLYRWQQYKLEEQEQRLLYKEQVSLRLQAEEYKKESVVKKQQELEAQKEELEKELRSTKIQLVIKAKEDEDKRRLIQTINDKLRKLQGTEGGNRMKMKELFRIIDSHQEKENNTFQIHMDELNQEFTQKIKERYPSLTMYDLRLCTYIRTGLSTREIAEMMHVLPSSINVSRSRLRKKLKLEAKEDLFSFLESI